MSWSARLRDTATFRKALPSSPLNTASLTRATMPPMMRLMSAAPVPGAGAVSESPGAPRMPSMDCPNCDGTGYTQDASGEDVICPMCDGTGVIIDDEGDANAE